MEKLEHRLIGCQAELSDDGYTQKIPVCMGGTAIVGCNNPDFCSRLYNNRMEDGYHNFVAFVDKDSQRVERIEQFAREPLVPVKSP